MLLSFEQALSIVQKKLTEADPLGKQETVRLHEGVGRILGEDVLADRDCPPFDRATRDGFAVRAKDAETAPVTLECIGEARAGKPFAESIQTGQCVEIMTGAPVPEGADAVVMIESTRTQDRQVEVLRAVAPSENIVGRGAEAACGAQILRRGQQLGPDEIALLASVGRREAVVFRRPVVAVLSTGDEVVPVDCQPEWFQVRDSNASALAALIQAAGAVPREIGIAADEKKALRPMIEQAFEADMVALSGGVSAGKYDFVEDVLKEFGAEFFFESVAIRPGKPLVFGRAKGKFFFGLPGNPVSTLVTFRLFARPAILALQGGRFEIPAFPRARLAATVRQSAGLTRFMPARVEMRNGEAVVERVPWQGSGDLAGLTAANCFLVAHPEQTELAAGSWVDVLLKND
jgi:molybdopterin molybdotransferase